MLILISIGVQYLQSIALSFEKSSKVRITPQIPTTLNKKIPPSKMSDSPIGGFPLRFLQPNSYLENPAQYYDVFTPFLLFRVFQLR